MYPPSFRVERCLSRVSFPPKSDQPFGRYERIYKNTWHVPPARAKGTPPSFTTMAHALSAYQPTKFEPNPSIGLACSGVQMTFATFCKIARGTCRSVRNRHHRLSAAPAHRTNIRPSRSEQPFGLQKRKCLDTHTHTLETHRQKSAQLLFSSDPPEEIFEQSFQC